MYHQLLTCIRNNIALVHQIFSLQMRRNHLYLLKLVVNVPVDNCKTRKSDNLSDFCEKKERRKRHSYVSIKTGSCHTVQTKKIRTESQISLNT